MVLEHGQAIYCWKTQYLISKIIYNIVLYPETLRVMARSNKVTHKMTIVGKFAMPRIPGSYIDWLYNYGQVILSRKEKCLPVKMRCDMELWDEVVCVERRSIRVTVNVNEWTLEIEPFSSFIGCLYLRHLHTHRHITYHWKPFLSPWQWSTQPNHQMMYYTSSEG